MRRTPVARAVTVSKTRSNPIRIRPRASMIAVAAAFAAVPHAQAADVATDTNSLESIVVTAQKRTENLQEVPVAIQAMGTEKLEELHVQSLDDYVKLMPSVTFQRSQGEGGSGQPGTAHVYIRGVVSGGDGNHSGSLPSVGTYLDEQPVTTIDGALDVHIYDIERVEVLKGPQGTLYGASSEAGTIRIITNKPEIGKFSAAYDLSIDTVKHGQGLGHTEEGLLNLPIGKNAAIRLVGWNEHDAGFIDNVAGTNASAGIVNGVRTFPSWNATPANGGVGNGLVPGIVGQGAISNQNDVRKGYNTVDTKGGRGALRFDLNDNWTITPTFMAQNSRAKGFFGYDPAIGDLQVTHFGQENSVDSFNQTALTIEGRVADFDITYAGAYMRRDSHTVADYSDYSFFYDSLFAYGKYYVDNAGKLIDPVQIIYGDSWFTKQSHEVRLSTPKKYPVKATVGAFVQKQVHEIYQRYAMPGYNGDGLADALSIPGWYQALWLTDEERVDKDRALFAQGTWDISPHLSVTAGMRQFWYDNSLQGFYGYSANFSSSTGVAKCGPKGGTPNPTFAPFHGSPCTNLNNDTKGSGHTPLLTLTYFGDEDFMAYATYSKGFRPGGANRATDPNTHQPIGAYATEYLVNYELGWKAQFDNRHVRWNGAIFREKWNNFQFSYLVPPSLTAIANAGQAQIDGAESDLDWVVGGGLTMAFNLTYLNGRLMQNYCLLNDCVNLLQARKGDRLPISPKLKGDIVARYVFNMDGGWKDHLQATWTHQGDSSPLLIESQAQALGMQKEYSMLDLSAGGERNGMSIGMFVTNVFDRRAELTRFAECKSTVCSQTYIVPSQPRTIGIKFGQKF